MEKPTIRTGNCTNLKKKHQSEATIGDLRTRETSLSVSYLLMCASYAIVKVATRLSIERKLVSFLLEQRAFSLPRVAVMIPTYQALPQVTLMTLQPMIKLKFPMPFHVSTVRSFAAMGISKSKKILVVDGQLWTQVHRLFGRLGVIMYRLQLPQVL